MTTLTKKQLEILVNSLDEQQKMPVNYRLYTLYFTIKGNGKEAKIKAYSKHDAHLKLINNGSIDENVSIDGYYSL
ncbi:Hypothetical protein DAL_144 [Psychrobacter phage D'Alembert]|nr:Hypothetical protein DAL_1 [Psychrobacter phage D'Alembert]CAH1193526.1 Hypothetical protein DAL_144 [Psychrobacter phage D'Alembert]